MEPISIAAYILFTILLLWIKTSIKSTVEHEFNVRIESIKSEFAKEAEARERKDKFRLAALDERLRVHQKAYELSAKFLPLLFNEKEKINHLNECKVFWNSNCLYLSTKAKDAFRKAYMYYMQYDLLLTNWQESRSDDNYKKLMDAYNHITNTPLFISQSIDLEAMGEGASIEEQEKDFKGAAL